MRAQLFFLSFLFLQACSLEMETLNQWNLADFNFPRNYDLSQFRPENTVFTGLEITEDRFFVAFPRLRVGVPATVGMIPRNTPKGSSPVIQAYPDWSFHTIGQGNNNSCDGLTSVYRLRQDSCNRLWALDSGIMTSLDDFRRVCPPKIMIFDLSTNQVARTVIFPREVLRPNSLLANLIIDESVQGPCDSAMVYIADTAAPGMIVYDSSKDSAWRFMHPSMFPDPDFSDYNIDGEQFTLMDGVVGLAHSPRLGVVYFQPLATDRIFSVPTSVLRRGPLPEGEALPVSLVGKKSSQGLGLAVDQRDDTLYFSPLAETSLATWNPITNRQQLVAYDRQRLQFPAEIRWAEKDGGSIYMLTTRFQKYFKRTVRAEEINLRIIRITNRAQTNFPVNNNIFL